MTRRGLPTTRDGKDIAVVVLMDTWAKHFKSKPSVRFPSRPTFYDWMKHKDPKISPTNLFLLSDVLQVNARWLALNEGSMSKPIVAEMDAQALFDAWEHLGPTAREELIREAQKLLRVQGTPSPASPFVTPKK